MKDFHKTRFEGSVVVRHRNVVFFFISLPVNNMEDVPTCEVRATTAPLTLWYLSDVWW